MSHLCLEKVTERCHSHFKEIFIFAFVLCGVAFMQKIIIVFHDVSRFMSFRDLQMNYFSGVDFFSLSVLTFCLHNFCNFSVQ